jgi:hypothetical protein
MQASVAYAAPVYIASSGDFPAYPYNTGAYTNGAGDYVGCGPTTGAMILGYFAHHFSLAGLLTPPTPSTVDEGLATAWSLHSASYMQTYGAADELANPAHQNGFGSVYNIKPGLENYAEDRGYEVKVMAHAITSADPATSWYNDYGAYGDAWTNDGIFWDNSGGVWSIDPDLFCDWAEPKLAAGIAIFLTIDTVGNYDIYGDHWVPCVGVDRDTNVYYWYDTYGTSLRSNTIRYCTEGIYGINFVRTVEYIPAEGGPPVASFTESAHTVLVNTAIDFDASGSYDTDGTIVAYEWDWETDGTYDYSSASATASHTYSTAGMYTVTLRVTDNDGLTDTAVATKTVFEEIGPVIPEVPLGTIVISASMIIALGAYLAMPRLRRKSEYIKL